MGGVNGHRRGATLVDMGLGVSEAERSEQEALAASRDREQRLRDADARQRSNRRHIESFLRCFGDGA